MSSFPDAPMFARWRIELESPVSLRGARSGSLSTTSTVFVGLDESRYPLSQPRALRSDSISRLGFDLDSLPDIGVDPIQWISVSVLHGQPWSVEPFMREDEAP
jgi:hypothetical protein